MFQTYKADFKISPKHYSVNTDNLPQKQMIGVNFEREYREETNLKIFTDWKLKKIENLWKLECLTQSWALIFNRAI